MHRTRRPRPGPTPPRSHPTHARPEGIVHGVAESALRRWADKRPFLAGLCLVVGGIEVGCWSAMPSLLGARSGVSAVMFMALLVADGFAVWFLPHYRKLLGVQAAVLGLLALTTTNLGGLFVGTSAAVVGGALAYRWTPGLTSSTSTDSTESTDAAPPTDSTEFTAPSESGTEPAGTGTDELSPEPADEPRPAARRRRPAPRPGPARPAVVRLTAAHTVARRPRPSASVAEDELVTARAQLDEDSFIPGF